MIGNDFVASGEREIKKKKVFKGGGNSSMGTMVKEIGSDSPYKEEGSIGPVVPKKEKGVNIGKTNDTGVELQIYTHGDRYGP